MAKPTLEEIISIIREIREDLVDDSITADTQPLVDLGLDSLDLIQLSRIIRKRFNQELFIEAWQWKTQPLVSITDHIHAL